MSTNPDKIKIPGELVEKLELEREKLYKLKRRLDGDKNKVNEAEVQKAVTSAESILSELGTFLDTVPDPDKDYEESPLSKNDTALVNEVVLALEGLKRERLENVADDQQVSIERDIQEMHSAMRIVEIQKILKKAELKGEELKNEHELSEHLGKFLQENLNKLKFKPSPQEIYVAISVVVAELLKEKLEPPISDHLAAEIAEAPTHYSERVAEMGSQPHVQSAQAQSLSSERAQPDAVPSQVQSSNMQQPQPPAEGSISNLPTSTSQQRVSSAQPPRGDVEVVDRYFKIIYRDAIEEYLFESHEVQEGELFYGPAVALNLEIREYINSKTVVNAEEHLKKIEHFNKELGVLLELGALKSEVDEEIAKIKVQPDAGVPPNENEIEQIRSKIKEKLKKDFDSKISEAQTSYFAVSVSGAPQQAASSQAAQSSKEESGQNMSALEKIEEASQSNVEAYVKKINAEMEDFLADALDVGESYAEEPFYEPYAALLKEIEKYEDSEDVKSKEEHDVIINNFIQRSTVLLESKLQTEIDKEIAETERSVGLLAPNKVEIDLIREKVKNKIRDNFDQKIKDAQISYSDRFAETAEVERTGQSSMKQTDLPSQPHVQSTQAQALSSERAQPAAPSSDSSNLNSQLAQFQQQATNAEIQNQGLRSDIQSGSAITQLMKARTTSQDRGVTPSNNQGVSNQQSNEPAPKPIPHSKKATPDASPTPVIAPESPSPRDQRITKFIKKIDGKFTEYTDKHKKDQGEGKTVETLWGKVRFRTKSDHIEKARIVRDIQSELAKLTYNFDGVETPAGKAGGIDALIRTVDKEITNNAKATAGPSWSLEGILKDIKKELTEIKKEFAPTQKKAGTQKSDKLPRPRDDRDDSYRM